MSETSNDCLKRSNATKKHAEIYDLRRSNLFFTFNTDVSPFTLEAIAKFYRNGTTITNDPINTGSLEELLDLLDDSQGNSSTNDESNNASADVTDFMQFINEDHQV